MMKNPIKVLIVDDHEVVRMGLCSLLSREASMEVVGEAGSAGEAIALAANSSPDVVVMDIRLPDGSGVEACREIRARYPRTKVIMLTSYADDEAVFSSIMAGAAGYLLKQTRGRELVRAVEAVASGQSLLDPTVTHKILESFKRMAADQTINELSHLSEQERRILALVAEGKTNKEIAELVRLSDKTIKNYISNILSKLNLSRRSQAAAYFARRAQGRED